MIFRQLVYLDALARERHFRRAADSCNISQPTLSAAIAQLESELGVMIVKRGRRFIGLTEEGELVVAHARRILADAQAMRASVEELRTGLRGMLRLGAIPTALPLVAHITAPFSRRYPNVKLTVLSLTSQEIQSRIDNFELDVGLTYLDNEPLSNVKPKPVYYESYVVLFRDDSELARSRTIEWAQAATLNLCLLTPDMQNRRILDRLLRNAGTELRPTLESNSIVVLVSHVQTGRWACVLPEKLAQIFGLTPRLRAIPIVEPEEVHAVGLVLPNREPVSPLVAALVNVAEGLARGQATLA